MEFDWDRTKDRSNLRKHGVSFELASTIFDDPQALSVRDENGDGRAMANGGIGYEAAMILVVHTWEERADETIIRIISARKATRHEREAYEEQREKHG